MNAQQQNQIPDIGGGQEETATMRPNPGTARRRRGVRARLALLAVLAVMTLVATTVPGPTDRAQPASAAGVGTLVLYDSTGAWGHLGEQYAILTANLVSKFGTWQARPVGTYTAGQMAAFANVIYIGSTYDEPLPTAFLDDTLAGGTPVTWLYNNLWQLTARSAAKGAFFSNTYGWDWISYDTSPISRVDYKSTQFVRYSPSMSGIMNTTTVDPTKVTVPAEAVRADGTRFPWAIRTPTKNFTYVGEIPYAYSSENDRYVAFAGMLQDWLAPNLAVQRRALVRIEDVGPDADPAALRAIADYLFSQGVPFSVATYSFYRDPLGVNNGGVAEQVRLRQRTQVVNALKYMQSKGGTLVMHGWTHQLNSLINPYDATSGNDFEFWMAHVDANDSVIYDGPVSGDSVAWARGRMNSHTTDFAAVGLAKPNTLVFPHYAASAADYEAARLTYGRHYGRMLYFNGVTRGYAQADYSKPLIGQFFPYAGITDVYGLKIVPENLGNYEPEGFNNHPARLPADIIATAQRNLALTDAVASFFYHPYLPLSGLQSIVSGIKGLGYTFVPNSSV